MKASGRCRQVNNTYTHTHPQGGQVDVIQTPRRCVFWHFYSDSGGNSKYVLQNCSYDSGIYIWSVDFFQWTVQKNLWGPRRNIWLVPAATSLTDNSCRISDHKMFVSSLSENKGFFKAKWSGSSCKCSRNASRTFIDDKGWGWAYNPEDCMATFTWAWIRCATLHSVSKLILAALRKLSQAYLSQSRIIYTRAV